MTMSERELEQLLHQAWHLPRGPSRSAALDTVFRHADAAGLSEFAFNARMSAIEEFHNAGDPTRAFLAFSWCLAAVDRAEFPIRSGAERSLLWAFKWIVWALPQFSEIPLDRTHAVLDDMQRRYQLGGHSLHAVYQHRWLVAHHTGDAAGAEHWYEQLRTARRDSLSDCRACVPSSQVKHLASIERDEEAVAIGAPFTWGGCTEQPMWMLSELVLPYLRTGRFAEAADGYRRAYTAMRNNPHHLDNIAQQLLFCGLTGNEARGLEMIEHHLPWLDRPSTPFAELEFRTAAALVLRRLRETGHGDLAIRVSSDGITKESTVDAIWVDIVARAEALAGQFDARNANTYQSERCAARMALAPITTELALTGARSGPDPGPPDPSRPGRPADRRRWSWVPWRRRPRSAPTN
jgi:hypothetical protein